MASTTGIINFDTASLLNYFNARIQASVKPSSPAGSAQKNAPSGAGPTPPWQAPKQTQEAQDAQTLSVTDFFDGARLSASAANGKTAEDNQNLFSLYQAVNTLENLAGLAARDGMTEGQLAGFNTRFQNGLQQVQSFLKTTTFNNFTLQATTPGSSVTSAVSIPFATSQYTGGTVAKGDAVSDPLSGVSASDSFTVSIRKGSTTTPIAIDLSQVQGPLTLDNIVNYVNQQIKAAGFSTRFSKVMTGGSIDDPENATWGIAISDVPSETVSLSSASATPALYLAGSTGSATGITAGSSSADPDQSGHLVKLSGLDATPQGTFSRNIAPDSGTATAQSTAVDSNGNVYVIGTSAGSFGTQLNQAAQDVYLTKYDSAGNVQWTRLLGASGMASAFSLAVDPAGGVAVAGSTTSDLSTTAVADGNSDSFVAKFDANGEQSWVQQIQTLNANQGFAVGVDQSGNVYLGGQASGVIASGQSNAGGSDAYLAKYDSSGKLVSESQFGTGGADQVSQLATAADGSLIAASVQNGHAILSKYANGDITSTPVWQMDLGDLQNGGAITGLAISGNQIYLAGTSSGVTGTGAQAVNSPSGMDAFVMGVTDNGTGATAGNLTYVGTGASDSAGALTVGTDGTVYLVGSTTGTFSGQSRTVAGTQNMFVSAVNPDGTIQWTRQYGGAEGISTGRGIAIDAQGSSVLDSLGLPRGEIAIPQLFDLAANTTLRAGDSFEIDVAGTSARKITIRIDDGETLQTLATKVNAALTFVGSAKVTYAQGGEALQISVNPGVTATLVPGPDGFDALGRLGIAAGVITKAPAKESADSSSSSASSADAPKVFGLGLSGNLDISTQSGAKMAKTMLSTVLSSIRNAYTQSNNPSPGATASPAAAGNAPAYLQSQIASYNVALGLFSSGTPGGTSA